MADTEYELMIRAYVKDEVTKALQTIKGSVEDVTKANVAGNKAQAGAAAGAGLMDRQLASLAARYTPVILGTLAFHKALNLVGQAQRFVIDESIRMITLSSEVEQTQGALVAVFGDLAEAQEEFIKKQSDATARFSNDIRQAEVDLGTTLEGLGLHGKAAADATNELTDAAIDFAAALKQPDEEVFERLEKGIAGSDKAFRALGISTNKAKVEQEAYRLGLARVGQELTPAEEAITRIAIALQKAAEFEGEAEKQLSSFEGVLMQVNKTIQETRKELGDDLKDDVLKAVEAIGGLDEALSLIKVTLELVKSAAELTLAAFTGMAVAFDEVIQISQSLHGSSIIMGIADATQVGATIDTLAALGDKLDKMRFETTLEKGIASGALTEVQALEANFAVLEGMKGGMSHSEALRTVTQSLQISIAAATAKGLTEGAEEAKPKLEKLVEDLNKSKDPPVIDKAALADFLTKANASSLQDELQIADLLRERIESEKAIRDIRAGFDTGRTVEDEEKVNQLLTSQEELREQALVAAKNEVKIQADRLHILGLVGTTIDALFAKHKQILDLQYEHNQAVEEQRRAQELVALEIQNHREVLIQIKAGTSDVANALVDAAHGAEGAFERAFDTIERRIESAIVEATLLQGLFSLLTGTGFISAGTFNKFFGTTFSAHGNVFDHGDVVPFSRGGSFDHGEVTPFAAGGAFGGQGSIVRQPSLFDIGSVAETRPEAIMPLERMPGGKLGINSTGNGGGGSFTIAPGAITVLAQPGMNPEQIAAAVMAQIKTDPGFMRFMANVGGVT